MERWTKIDRQPIDNYEISSKGRIRTCDGVYLSIGVDKRGNNSVNLTNKDKKYHLSVAHLVYEYFGNPKLSPNSHIKHLDGNKSNNSIENLICSRTICDQPTDEQLAIFNEYAYRYVGDILNKMRIPPIVGRERDDLIQVSVIMIWNYLHRYNVGTSFYLFCKRLTRYAFLKEYKEAKEELAHIEYREEL